MLVPSTFTGRYKNMMMNSARTKAMARSRVQFLSSRLNTGRDAFSFAAAGSGLERSNIFLRDIYSTARRETSIGRECESQDRERGKHSGFRAKNIFAE